MTYPEQTYLRATCALSMVGSLFVIMTYCLFRKLRKLRYLALVFFVVINEFIAALGGVLGDNANATLVCIFQSVTVHANSLAATFWTTIIVYQLWIVVDRGEIIEDITKCHMFCIFFPLLMTILPLTTNTIGEPPEGGRCFIVQRPDSPEWGAKFWTFATFFFWIWLCVFLMTFGVIRVLIKVYWSGQPTELAYVSIKKLAFYPVAFVICWVPSLIPNILRFWCPNDNHCFGINRELLGDFGSEFHTIHGFVVAVIFFSQNAIVRNYWYRLIFFNRCHMRCFRKKVDDDYVVRVLPVRSEIDIIREETEDGDDDDEDEFRPEGGHHGNYYPDFFRKSRPESARKSRTRSGSVGIRQYNPDEENDIANAMLKQSLLDTPYDHQLNRISERSERTPSSEASGEPRGIFRTFWGPTRSEPKRIPQKDHHSSQYVPNSSGPYGQYGNPVFSDSPAHNNGRNKRYMQSTSSDLMKSPDGYSGDNRVKLIRGNPPGDTEDDGDDAYLMNRTLGAGAGQAGGQGSGKRRDTASWSSSSNQYGTSAERATRDFLQDKYTYTLSSSPKVSFLYSTGLNNGPEPFRFNSYNTTPPSSYKSDSPQIANTKGSLGPARSITPTGERSNNDKNQTSCVYTSTDSSVCSSHPQHTIQCSANTQKKQREATILEERQDSNIGSNDSSGSATPHLPIEQIYNPYNEFSVGHESRVLSIGDLDFMRHSTQSSQNGSTMLVDSARDSVSSEMHYRVRPFRSTRILHEHSDEDNDSADFGDSLPPPPAQFPDFTASSMASSWEFDEDTDMLDSYANTPEVALNGPLVPSLQPK